MPKTILLFVSEPDVQIAVRDLLTVEGYRVVETLCLDDARNVLDTQGDIGLFLLGLDALEQDQSRELYRHYCRAYRKRVALVLLTAYGFSEEEVRAWGCADVLKHPFDTRELLAVVGRNLGR